MTWDDVFQWGEGVPFVSGIFSQIRADEMNKVNLTASEVSQVINSAITRLRARKDAKYQDAIEALMRMRSKVPSLATKEAVQKRISKQKEQVSQLRNDISSLDVLQADADSQIGRALDDTDLSKSKKINKLKEIGKNVQQDIQKVEKRL